MRALPRTMPALVTPFDRRGEIDLTAHRSNVSRMWDLGIRGLLIAGSTGEGPYLEPGERRQLVTAAREAIPRTFLLCGVHAETVRQATGAMAEAHDAGADAVLVATPTTLVRHRPDLIESFFASVVASAPVPVMLYSVPRVTGVELEASSVTTLSRLPGVVGMKDSGGDPLRAGDIASSTGDEFALYIGATRALSMSVSAGAFGAITASANYAPLLVRDTVTASRRSIKASSELQSVLTEMSAGIERFGIPGVKYAAARVGLASGHARAPLQSITAAARTAIRRSLTIGGL